MKKFIITIIVLLLSAVLGIGAYFIWRLNGRIEEQSKEISTLVNEVKEKKEENNAAERSTTNKIVNNTNTTTDATNGGSTSTVSKTDEEIIKEAYLKKIKESYLNCSDYRIDSVKVLNTAEKQSLVNSIPEYKDAEILAIVTYSIKPQDISNYVIAGNGEISGEWVVNKSACVSYKNGAIATDGTGW